MKMSNVLKITKSHFSIEKICLKALPLMLGVTLLVLISHVFHFPYITQSFVIYTTVFVGCVPISVISRITSYDKKQGVNTNNNEYFLSLIVFAIVCFLIGIVPFAITSGFVGKALAVFFAINFFAWIVSSLIGVLLASMSGRWRIVLKLSILGIFLVNIINHAVINYSFNINSTFISKIMAGYYVEQTLNMNNDLFNNYFDNILFGMFMVFINFVLLSIVFFCVYRRNLKKQ